MEGLEIPICLFFSLKNWKPVKKVKDKIRRSDMSFRNLWQGSERQRKH